MAERIAGAARMVLVASGKGGVGKTTVTVSLALALAARGARVGLYDADLYGPNVPLMLGVRRRASAAAGATLTAARAADVAPFIPPLERYGLRVMSIGLLVGEGDAVLPDPHFAGAIVGQTLRDVRWGELDYLLVDLPPGTGEPQQSMVRRFAWDGVVVVTTPQDMAQLDASRALGLYRAAGVPLLGAVENMSYMVCPHCGERVEVFARSGRAWAVGGEEVELLGRVPLALAISRGVEPGHPLLDPAADAPEAAPFRAIARRLAEKLA